MRPCAAVLCLALVPACKKPAPVPSESEAASTQAEPARAAQPLAAIEESEKDAVLTGEHVTKFIAYQKEKVVVLRTALEQWRKDAGALEKNKDPSLRQGLQALDASRRVQERLDREEARLREKAGLSKAEVDKLTKVVGDIGTQRMLWKKNGETALAEMTKQMAAQLKAMPADKQAEMRAALAETTASMTAMRDLAEPRKQYGDALVDAVLAHEDEVVGLAEQQMKLFSEMR